MHFSLITLRRLVIAAAASTALAAIALPAMAQMRQQMADKVATNAAHQFVTKINGESCSQFAQTMSQMKGSSGSSSSSSGGMASKLKANSQARTDFVNIVAGPLLNKMIDCNALPGGM
jgi:glutamate 5-kinase